MSATQSRSGADSSEIALDEVGRGRHLGAAPGRARPFAAMAAVQSGDAQQARDPFARAAHAFLAQFGMDARRAVGAATALMDRRESAR